MKWVSSVTPKILGDLFSVATASPILNNSGGGFRHARWGGICADHVVRFLNLTIDA